MKISQIKVSNLFMFPYIKDFSIKQGILFDAEEKENFNILIGPNGAGKSTFLDIINQIFRVGLIKQYYYNKLLLKKDIKDFKTIITLPKTKVDNFFKNFLSPNKISKVALSLKLNKHDFENIGFMSKYYDLLNDVIKKYSDLDLTFEKYDNISLLFENEIYLEFTIDVDTGFIYISNYDKLSKSMKYILFYIQNLELIQICINIYNDFMRVGLEKKLYPLKNTFAFLKSEKSFPDSKEVFNGLVIDSIADRSNNLEMNSKDKFSSVFVGYDLFIIKLIKIVKDNLMLEGREFAVVTPQEKIKLIENSKLFTDVSGYIFQLLGFKLNFSINSDDLIFIVFKNKRGIDISFENLSSGEKSIVMIIFSLFGYDLSNGLFIIDEIELHLHPYMLKKLLEVLKIFGSKLNMQFICATHSPLLIDEQSINNVYKFSLIDGKTTINYPIGGVRDEEATLIHILKFENVSKIFFIDKIIMVEGETDEYFWRFYLNYLSKIPKYNGKFDSYEILNINGKGSYKKRSKFLHKFGIKTYFIGDWDNTIENKIIDTQEMSEYIELTKKYFASNHINKEKFYTRIIDTIKRVYPVKYEYITKKIKDFYNFGVFILIKGDLEAYLGLKRKGLESTITFCNNDINHWLYDNKMKSYKDEFDNIIKYIFDIE